MLIENRFDVAAPPDEVYRLMLDVERVAPCIPGAEVTGRRDDGGYDARVSIKLGPVTMSYRGSVAISEQDPARRSATMLAKGSEARGQGTAQATMRMAVEPAGSGSAVSVSTDLQITGRVAQMGKGIMEDVATRMIGDMAACMEQRLAGPSADEVAESGEAAAAQPVDDARPAAAAPVGALSLVGSVVAGRLRRPLPLALGAILATLLLGLVHRRRRARSRTERLRDTVGELKDTVGELTDTVGGPLRRIGKPWR